MSLSLLAGYGSSDEGGSDQEEDTKQSSDSPTATEITKSKVDDVPQKIKLPSALDLLSGKGPMNFSSGPFVGTRYLFRLFVD